MRLLYGVTVPLVTPLTKERTLDISSLEHLTDFLIEKGIHCLYPGGTTGEMMLMGMEDRKVLAETVVRQTAGRAVVYIQAGAVNQADTITLAKHAVDIGADGIGVVTPVFYKLSDRELVSYYQSVCRSVPSDFPVYLYAIPQCAVNDITPALAEELAETCPNIAGIKYSYPNMSRIQEFMTIRSGSFSVLCGPDELFCAAVLTGGAGTVSGNAQVIPEHYVAIWNALERGDIPTAVSLQRKTNQLNQILSNDHNIARYKAALKYRKILSDASTYAPLEPLSEAESRSMSDMLEELKFTEI
ncbi:MULTISPECIES: dihydrodipicolinate synthase family protein [unclassified Clostridium]|uniref:dihydrodipicolinate synthase family protein n=1 Tax=unclassified Clostridium TaxID=2614128 RepID=UPI0011065FD7|nr:MULTISPECIES: dihydrodipicolinate synthase family protein [unclassified Clostridium]